MKVTPFYAALLLILAIAAGSLGDYATNRWIVDHDAPHGMPDFVHRELHLTKSQQEQLDTLETNFSVERRRLELALKTANASLAAAMDEEHSYGPKVSDAIDEVHARMGDLEKATVRHVLRMRGLLNTHQQQAFDREVSRALTSEAKP